MKSYRDTAVPIGYTLLCVLTGFAAVGCNAANGVSNANGASNGTSSGATVARAIQPHHAVMTPHTPLRTHTKLATWIDQKPGYKWSVILQEGEKAYVGTFPQFQAPAPKGAAPQNPHQWPKSYDTPAELQRLSPDDYIRALRETPPRADTYDKRMHSASGSMLPADQADIQKKVKGAIPEVRSVLITTDVASAAILRGYAEYVQSGGDMSRYMARFHDRVNKIWPNGRGVAPDRPSASPDFGTFGAPADTRTPVHGHVHA